MRREGCDAVPAGPGLEFRQRVYATQGSIRVCSFGCRIRGVRLDARRARRSHGPSHDDRGSDRRAPRRRSRSSRPTAGRCSSSGRRPTARPARGTRTSGACRRTDPAEAKALIDGDKSENTPRWSPDGKRIAFLANRDGATQVYVADADGGDVKKVTSLHAGAQPPLVWSPDGERVAFVSDVYPECADEDCNKKKTEEAEQNPVKVHRLTRLLYRHWDEWRENIRHHVFVATVADGKARDLTPGDFDSPPTQQEDGAHRLLAGRPRRSRSCPTAKGTTRKRGRRTTTSFSCRWTAASRGKLTKNPAADTHPVFSRDGRTLYVLAQRRAGLRIGPLVSRRLRRPERARSARSSRRRTSRSATITLSQDGKRRSGSPPATTDATNLFIVPAAGGDAEARAAGRSDLGRVQPGAGFVVFSKSSLTAPPEIFRASADGSGREAAHARERGLAQGRGVHASPRA